jgi:hypothetical protein
MHSHPTDMPRGAQLAFLHLLAQPSDASGFIDVRWRKRGGTMRRRFFSASDLNGVAELLTRLAAKNDVYVGVAVRDSDLHGGRAAIGAAHLVWVESDDPRTAPRLGAFAHPPTMVVASGTPGHLQIYWLLDHSYPIEEVESANHRLAVALAGDTGCADGARILRPPDTFNHKHDPPRPVTLLLYRPEPRHELASLTEGLLEHSGSRTTPGPPILARAGRSRLDRELLSVPAEDYVRVLTGSSPNREGKVRCPFHEDNEPSLQLYADGGFYCFGSQCRRGGTIFDFAAHLWGVTPRGVAFLELRTRLANQFGLNSD